MARITVITGAITESAPCVAMKRLFLLALLQSAPALAAPVVLDCKTVAPYVGVANYPEKFVIDIENRSIDHYWPGNPSSSRFHEVPIVPTRFSQVLKIVSVPPTTISTDFYTIDRTTLMVSSRASTSRCQLGTDADLPKAKF